MLVRLLAPSPSLSISIHPSIHIVLCALITSLIRPMHVPKWRKQDGGSRSSPVSLRSIPFRSVSILRTRWWQAVMNRAWLPWFVFSSSPSHTWSMIDGWIDNFKKTLKSWQRYQMAQNRIVRSQGLPPPLSMSMSLAGWMGYVSISFSWHDWNETKWNVCFGIPVSSRS